MADISAEIAAFKNAVYGEDVRDAMVSLANKINNENVEASFYTAAIYADSTNIPIVKGTSTWALDDQNEITITSATTRAIAGPFYAYGSFVVVPKNSNVKTEIRAVNTAVSASSAVVIKSFNSNPGIIGTIPEMSKYVKYYVLIGHVDETTIQDSELRQLIVLKQDSSNLYNTMGLRTISITSIDGDKKPLPVFSGSSNYRFLCKIDIVEKIKIYCAVDYVIYIPVFNEVTSQTEFLSKTYDANTYSEYISSDYVYIMGNLTKLYSNYQTFSELYQDIDLRIFYSNDLVFDKIKYPLDSFQIGMLSISNPTVSDRITYRASGITYSSSTITMGPFFITEDTVISCSDNVVCDLKYIFDSEDELQSAYRSHTMKQSWIIGISPGYQYLKKYYLLIKYSDGSAIRNPKDVLSKVHFYKGYNPLHLSSFEKYLTGVIPMGYPSGNLSRFFFEFESKTPFYFGVGNLNVRWNMKNLDTNIEVFAGGSHPNKHLSAGHYRVGLWLSTNEDLTSIVSSFEELYNILQIRIDDFDYKKIDGTAIYESRIMYYDSIIQKGINYSNSVLTDPTVITPNGYQYSHTPWIGLKNNTAYITFQSSENNIETDNTTTVFLAEVDIDTRNVTHYIIAKYGTYNGLTFNGPCTNGIGHIIGNEVHVLTNTTINSVKHLIHTVFNMDNKSLTSTICKILVDDNSYDFNVDNFDSYIGRPNNMEYLGYEIIMSEPQIYNDEYLCTVTSGQFANGIVAIMKSSDLTNWEVFTFLPAKCGADCETPIKVVGDYLYGASRHHYSNYTLTIWKMDLSTKEVVDTLQIPDVAMRPSFIETIDGDILLSHGTYGRRIEIIKLNTNYIANSISHLMTTTGFGYHWIVNDGSTYYIATQSGLGMIFNTVSL